MDKNISGPISYKVYQYKGDYYYCFSDQHFSKDGGCGTDCDRFISATEIRRNDSGCIDFPLYIHDVLSDANKREENVDFYFESPFVLLDDIPSIPRNDFQSLDYIDTIKECMRMALLRDKKKSPYMPYCRVHYCDIREVYDQPYNSDGTRISTNANPFSGSWISNLLSTIIKEYNITRDIKSFKRQCNEVYTSVKFILDNSDMLCKVFLVPGFTLPKLGDNVKISDEWKTRVSNIALMMSKYNNQVMHRVAKQLAKVDIETRLSIETWYNTAYKKVLEESHSSLEKWRGYIDKLTSNDGYDYISKYSRDNSIANNISNYMISDEYDYVSTFIELPIDILIPISSLLMDVYILGRCMYNHSNRKYFFAGAAHIRNYCSYLEQNGATIVENKSGMPCSVRCIVAR